jgi:Flp pilus assembly protein TadB
MTRNAQSVVPAFIIAALAILIAVVTGVGWLGQPLRLVHLITIVGLSMTAGVLWSQAVMRAQRAREESPRDVEPS